MTQRWFCKHKENIAPNAFWMRLGRHCLHASHYAEQQGGMCHHTWLKRLYIQKKCNYGMVSKSVQSGNTFKATLRSGSSHTRKTPNLVRSNDSWKPKAPLTCYYCILLLYSLHFLAIRHQLLLPTEEDANIFSKQKTHCIFCFKAENI